MTEEPLNPVGLTLDEAVKAYAIMALKDIPRTRQAEASAKIAYDSMSATYSSMDGAKSGRRGVVWMMCNLLHLCDRYGIDHAVLVDEAQSLYKRELEK